MTKLGVEGCPVTVNGKHTPGQRGPKIGPSRVEKARKLIVAYWALVLGGRRRTFADINGSSVHILLPSYVAVGLMLTRKIRPEHALVPICLHVSSISVVLEPAGFKLVREIGPMWGSGSTKPDNMGP
jgi:hypothetical protein